MESSAVLDVLSLTVIATCFAVKIPQILSILRAGNTKGLSLSSILLEECGYSVLLSYNFAMGYPLSTYFEFTFLVLQDLILIIAVLHYNDLLKIKILPLFILYFFVYCGLGYRWFPDFVLKLSISLVTPLSFFSKSAQIRVLYKQKNPGQVSLFTWIIVTYGATVRFLTSTFQTGDLAVMTNYFVAASLNATIVCMILYYKRQLKTKMY